MLLYVAGTARAVPQYAIPRTIEGGKSDVEHKATSPQTYQEARDCCCCVLGLGNREPCHSWTYNIKPDTILQFLPFAI